MEIILQNGPWFIGLAALFGIYMCWGIGANDVANAMGTSVGSRAVTVKQAIIIAAIFEFAGAVLAGGHVTSTVRKGIIDPTGIVDQPEILVYGMLASLLAAAVWLMIASYKGWPVSTTHSIVGALVGFGMVGIGEGAVQWAKIWQIVASWVVSPLTGGTIAFLLMISVRRLILNKDNPFESAKKWGPVYVFLVGFIIALVTIFKGLKHLDIELTATMSFIWSVFIGLLIALLGWYFIRKQEADPTAEKTFLYASVEKVFGRCRCSPPVRWPLHTAPTTLPMALGRWPLWSVPCKPVAKCCNNQICRSGSCCSVGSGLCWVWLRSATG